MARTIAIFLLAGAVFAETAGGIHWTPPKAWHPQGERPMRAATYQVPAAPGDKDNGECAVFYFGPGQGGGVEANLDRWTAQFRNPEGKKIQKKTINGFNVTTIELSGAYTGMGGPMAPPGEPKPGYRLLGAIVEAPQGAVFFKFTGPAKTVTANAAAFDSLLKSMAK